MPMRAASPARKGRNELVSRQYYFVAFCFTGNHEPFFFDVMNAETAGSTQDELEGFVIDSQPPAGIARRTGEPISFDFSFLKGTNRVVKTLPRYGKVGTSEAGLVKDCRLNVYDP
jgi:hypothetical protein